MPRKRDTTPVRKSSTKKSKASSSSSDSPQSQKPQSVVWEREGVASKEKRSNKRSVSPIRESGSSKPSSDRSSASRPREGGSSRENSAKNRSISPARKSGSSQPSSEKSSTSNNSGKDDESGNLWRMPRRGQSGSQERRRSGKGGSSNGPRRNSSSGSRTPPPASTTRRTVKKPSTLVDIDMDDDDEIEILVPPKPQSARVGVSGARPQRSAEKRRSEPVQNRSIEKKKRPPSRGLSPVPTKSFNGRPQEKRVPTTPTRNKSMPHRLSTQNNRVVGAKKTPKSKSKNLKQEEPVGWERNAPSKSKSSSSSLSSSTLEDFIPIVPETPPQTKKAAVSGKHPKTPKLDWQRVAENRKRQVVRSPSPNKEAKPSSRRSGVSQPRDKSPVRRRRSGDHQIRDKSPVRDRSPPVRDRSPVRERPVRDRSPVRNPSSQRSAGSGSSQGSAIARSSGPRPVRYSQPPQAVVPTQSGAIPPRPRRSTYPAKSQAPAPRPVGPLPEHMGRYAASGGLTQASRFGKMEYQRPGRQPANVKPKQVFKPPPKPMYQPPPKPMYQPSRPGQVAGVPPGRRKVQPAPPGRGRGYPVRGGRGRGYPVRGGRGRGYPVPVGSGSGQGRGAMRVPPKPNLVPVPVIDKPPPPLTVADALPSPEPETKKKSFPKARMKGLEDLSFDFPTISGDEKVAEEMYKNYGSVRILICSANLGNAQPDDMSLHEWVPSDGYLDYAIVDPPAYPVYLDTPTEEDNMASGPPMLDSIQEDGGQELDPEGTPVSYEQVERRSILPSKEIVLETVQDEDSDNASVVSAKMVEVTVELIDVTLEPKEAPMNEAHGTPRPSSEGRIEPLAIDHQSSVATESAKAVNSVDAPDNTLSTDSNLAVSTASEPQGLSSEQNERDDAAAEDPNFDSSLASNPPSIATEQTDAERIAPVDANKQDTPRKSLDNASEEEQNKPSKMKRRQSVTSSIREKFERKSSQALVFGDAFHEQQRAAQRDQKEREREAKERLQKGTVAPDLSFGEAFGGQQAAAMRGEKEKERQTREQIQRGGAATDLTFGEAFGGKQAAAVRNEKEKERKTKESLHKGTIAEKRTTDQNQEPPTGLNSLPSPENVDASNPQSGNSILNQEGKNEAGSQMAEHATPETGDGEAASEITPKDENVSWQKAQPSQMPKTEESAFGTGGTGGWDTSEGFDSFSSFPISNADGFGDFDQERDPNGPESFGPFDGATEDEWADNANASGEGWDAAEGGWADNWTAVDFGNESNAYDDDYGEQLPNGHFEIIVIGMQEATFDTQHDESSTQRGSERSERTVTLSSEDDSDIDIELDEDKGSEAFIGEIELSEEMQPVYTKSDGDLPILEDETSTSRNNRSQELVLPSVIEGDIAGDLISDQTLKRKKKRGVFGAAMKAGKKTLKVGKMTIKAGKKTAKAAQTLISEKNHTNREPPTAQQMSAPTEEGGMRAWEDTDVLHYMFDGQLPSYQRALSYQLGEMRLMVYYLKSSIALDVLSVNAKPTGKHNLANKGGIVTEVAVNGTTRLCFSSAHLEAHEGEEKFEKRCASFQRILNGAKSSVTPLPYDSSMASHYSFFMGDLNFRTKLPGLDAGSHEHILECHDLTTKGEWEVLNEHDELSRALAEKKCLVGWKTPYCNFDPTFKVARQDGYEYNILRSPSYTDRILYKALDQLETAIQVSLYEPISRFTSSDHKPIRGAFEVQLNEQLEVPQPIKVSRGLSNPGEEMHLLFTSIECQIEVEEYYRKHKSTDDGETLPPNPFLSFVSTPREALELDGSARRKGVWKRFGMRKSKKKPSRSKSNHALEKPNPFAKDWPGTKVAEASFKPKWNSEEIHFALRTETRNGAPIDLSGALLHLSLFDESEVVPALMGSFTLNLAAVIKMTLERKEGDVSGSVDLVSRHERAMGLTGASSEISQNPSSRMGRVPSERLSKKPSERLLDLMETATNESGEGKKASDQLKDMKIITLNIDEPLTSGGVQIGQIKCTVDAWWMQNDEDDSQP